jgi:hypothetical protein
MTTINRHDVISSGSIALAVSNLLPNKRHLRLVLAAAILSLSGAISAQAKQHEWAEDQESGSHYAASFRMPLAGHRTTHSAKPAPDCKQVLVRGCVPDGFDTVIDIYFPLTHGGPR